MRKNEVLVEDTDDVVEERLASADEVAGDVAVPGTEADDEVGGVAVAGGAVVSGETDGAVVGAVDPGGSG